MRFITCLVAAVALQLPAAVYAQHVSVGGWVNSVDTAGSTITIRTLGNPRTIQLAPNVVIHVNGVVSRLDQIPANGAVSITAERGPTGVLTATQISVRSSGPQPSAAAPPGSVVQGALVGMNVAGNSVTVRTTSGDHVVSLGTAPIMVNGKRGSIRNLALGQTIQVRRNLPTPASTDFITQAVWVLPSRSRVAGYRTSIAAPTTRATARKRTIKHKRKSTAHRSKKASRAQQQARKRHLARARRAESQAVRALTGTAPVTNAAPWGTSAAPVAMGAAPAAVIEPGVIYVVPGAADIAVPPITGVTTSSAPAGIVGTAPVTRSADARTLSAAAASSRAAGIADARRQTSAINGAAASGIPNARNQSVAPSGPLGAGAVPAAGVPDPRFQSLAPAVRGTMPSGFGRPGFVGPRALAPMTAPRATAPAVVAPRAR
jgi:hypothetical protein